MLQLPDFRTRGSFRRRLRRLPPMRASKLRRLKTGAPTQPLPAEWRDRMRRRRSNLLVNAPPVLAIALMPFFETPPTPWTIPVAVLVTLST